MNGRETVWLYKKNNPFYQNICHPLRLLKIPQIAIIGDLCCLKGSCFFFWILVQSDCPPNCPPKLRALTHPPSLLTSWERLWTFDLDKSQVRGRYSCVRDIRRSHCQPFCAHMSAQLEWVYACTILIKRNCPVKIFCLSCVCFQHWSVFNSNNLEAYLGFYIPSRKGGPSLSLGRCVLLPGCEGPEVRLRVTTFWIFEWTRTPEFLDNVGKSALKTGTVTTTKVLCRNQDKKRHRSDQVICC
jgi:hypothetical protein